MPSYRISYSLLPYVFKLCLIYSSDHAVLQIIPLAKINSYTIFESLLELYEIERQKLKHVSSGAQPLLKVEA